MEIRKQLGKLAFLFECEGPITISLGPAEVGPQLRLDYRDQPPGKSLNIAMKPVATYAGEPTILSLVNFGSGLALLGSNGRSEFKVPGYLRFVFALPGKLLLEAQEDHRQ